MGPQDPFSYLFPMWYEASELFGDIPYDIYFAFVMLTKLVWVMCGLGLFIYSRQLLIHRKRGNRRRIAEGKNGFGEIITVGRIGIALDFYQISIVMILLGVISFLTPPPIRPQGIFFVLTLNCGMLFIAYKCYHGAHTLYTSDRDGYRWLKTHAPYIQLVDEDD